VMVAQEMVVHRLMLATRCLLAPGGA
jgi:hypothetical protein